MSHALLVDLGGTSCRVGLAAEGLLLPGSVQTFSNAACTDLRELLLRYLNAQMVEIRYLCAGVAGPVKGNTAQLTNHAWFIDGPVLARALGAEKAILLNDLQAQAYALDDLAEEDVTTLIAAHPEPFNPRLTFCLGTGCNIAVAYRKGSDLFVPASESGHTTLPDAPDYRALYDSLRPNFPHLPIEAILSGPGLSRLHAFLTGESCTSEDILIAQPPETMETFAQILGMAMGNLALSHMTLGGVYLIGGLARAMSPHLIRHGLHAPFCDRGPYRDIMERMPIHVVLDDSAALRGCARYLRQNSRNPDTKTAFN